MRIIRLHTDSNTFTLRNISRSIKLQQVGRRGLKGEQGDAGEGVPTGGNANQVLAKIDGADYNTNWVDQTGSGGGGTWGSITGTLSSQTDLNSALTGKEDVSNKSTTTTLGTSDTLYPTQKAVKTYVDTNNTASLTSYDDTVLASLGVTGTDTQTVVDGFGVAMYNFGTSTSGSLAEKEVLANKDTTTSLGISDTKYPSQKAVKTYADTKVSGIVSSTDNAITRFDSTTGKLVQNSKVLVSDSGALQFDGSADMKVYKNLVVSRSALSTVTGTLKITLPFSWSNSMLKITVKGFDYTANSGSWQADITGFTYTTASYWYGASVAVSGTPPFSTARLAHDGTKCILLLGVVSTAWKNPMIEVSEVSVGGAQITGWGDGWVLSYITSEAGITGIVTPTFITSLSNRVIDTDVTLAGNLDTKISSQKAVKAYADVKTNAGTLASRVVASAVPHGAVYFATDEQGGTLYTKDGALGTGSWKKSAPSILEPSGKILASAIPASIASMPCTAGAMMKIPELTTGTFIFPSTPVYVTFPSMILFGAMSDPDATEFYIRYTKNAGSSWTTLVSYASYLVKNGGGYGFEVYTGGNFHLPFAGATGGDALTAGDTVQLALFIKRPDTLSILVTGAGGTNNPHITVLAG